MTTVATRIRLYVEPSDEECKQLSRKLDALDVSYELLSSRNRANAMFLYSEGCITVPQCYDGDVYVGDNYEDILEYIWSNYKESSNEYES